MFCQTFVTHLSLNFDNIFILKIYAQKNPAEIPWGTHNVDVVLECTGFFTDKT